MKASTKYVLLGAIGTMAIGGFLSASSSFAYKGNPEVQGPNYTPERHEEMEKVFESKDFDSWKSLMQNRGRVSEVVTKENFDRFVEMRNLRLEGKTDEANQIRAELGLGNGQGRGNGKMQNGEGRGQNRGGNFVDANGDGNCDNM